MGCGLYSCACFNPRICKRCDCAFCPTACIWYSFNPRICKRCDSLSLPSTTTLPVSIHASVKDATLSLLPFYIAKKGFNPRICKRCDFLATQFNQKPLRVSIHASVKDATLRAHMNIIGKKFQSTHL